MKLVVRGPTSPVVLAQSAELARKLEDFASREYQSQIRSRSMLWHEELEAGNSPIERLDLKIRHSKAARSTDRTNHGKVSVFKRPVKHQSVMNAVNEITSIVADQPTYSFSRWKDPEYRRVRYDRRIPQWQTAARNSPLHIAAAKAQFLTLEMILKRPGAEESNLVNEPNGDGDTALHLAVETGNVGVVDTLLHSQADVCGKNMRGDTPLIRAIKVRQRESVESLLTPGSNGSAAVNLENKDGLTPLLLCAHWGDVATFRLLVQRGANVAVRDGEGNSILHVAASEGRAQTVMDILDQKLCSIKAVNSQGWTALHFAAANGHVELIDLLVLEFGADINPLTIGDSLGKGETPCQIAFRHKHFPAFEKIISLGGQGAWTVLDARAQGGLHRGSGKRKSHSASGGRILSEKELRDIMNADKAKFEEKNTLKEGIQSLRVWPVLLGVTPELLYQKKFEHH